MADVLTALERRAAEAEARMSALEARLATGAFVHGQHESRHVLLLCLRACMQSAQPVATSSRAIGMLIWVFIKQVLPVGCLAPARQTCWSFVPCWLRRRRSRSNCARGGTRWGLVQHPLQSCNKRV